ncbi:unnamed protein product [Rotaria sp. Silwood1]|nr:unnamed protein product [Rotaria sp. Silwood1]CAF1167971.1 unnamed protein product [Rotaria sp. Silwood1]CAF3479340.1 unnamed protein product [Rotaria sp. Silwood1]CAF4654481.1 unnamed protein product [Rotaria sp. Silwood1]
MAYSYYDPIESAFAQADRNRDGVLDRNEFRNFLDFQNADRNRDGRVSYAEFANIAAPNLNIHPRYTARAFQIADRNHDGVLDQQELADFSDFQRADINHDGRVDQAEMRLFLHHNQMNMYSPYNYGQPYYRY